MTKKIIVKVYVEQERFSNSRPVGGAAKRGTDKRRKVEGAKKLPQYSIGGGGWVTVMVAAVRR